MRAVRLTQPGRGPELVELDVPIPIGRQILLQVEAIGLCRSDLSVMDAAIPRYALPFTLGHEIVGRAVSSGLELRDEVTLGSSYAVYGPRGCGSCPKCRLGAENYCAYPSSAPAPGLGRDGGLADYVLVEDPRYLVATGGMRAVDVAPLTDAGLTTIHALGTVASGSWSDNDVVIIGIGGLGHLALQLAKRRGSRTIAVDTSPDKLVHAASLGADVTTLLKDASTTLLGAGRLPRVARVLDLVGTSETLELASRLVAPGGTVALVGLAGGSFDYGFRTLPFGTHLVNPYWGTLPELAELLTAATSNPLTVETTQFVLDDYREAYQALRDGTHRGRIVVVPG